ncbi:uncharacterized protein [Fopius arisanus]|uniref:Uncharacterized protein isoform X2 n=1 Tax=Fopius arisanus TaxID=64838 RepID=A0A9R1TQ70_9HYME|nr:PREDICTED: uncharacterized protein LOC105273951 isoform X2 [Fopius arisanus]
MGIVSSTFVSLAIQFAWNFQRFLDPRYRYIESKKNPEAFSPHRAQSEGSTIEDVRPSTKAEESTSIQSNHQENRNRRAAQRRNRRKRPSSFDASLIVTNVSKTGITAARVVSSTPSTLTRQQAPGWDDSSASSTSSSEECDLDARAERIGSSETRGVLEKRHEARSMKFGMSATEEAAFRMTVGRGHFSRSKKDKFLNHLRLEKRLNGLNREFFELACRPHSRPQVDITSAI